MSYAPFMKQLAANGLACYRVAMPGNLAIFGMNKATDVTTFYKL
ncbi:MAG: alpha/beta hydrolase [Lachnospiraceae bacterium]